MRRRPESNRSGHRRPKAIEGRQPQTGQRNGPQAVSVGDETSDRNGRKEDIHPYAAQRQAGQHHDRRGDEHGGIAALRSRYGLRPIHGVERSRIAALRSRYGPVPSRLPRRPRTASNNRPRRRSAARCPKSGTTESCRHGRTHRSGPNPVPVMHPERRDAENRQDEHDQQGDRRPPLFVCHHNRITNFDPVAGESGCRMNERDGIRSESSLRKAL